MRADIAGRGGADLGLHRRLQPELGDQVPQGQHRRHGRRHLAPLLDPHLLSHLLRRPQEGGKGMVRFDYSTFLGKVFDKHMRKIA